LISQCEYQISVSNRDMKEVLEANFGTLPPDLMLHSLSSSSIRHKARSPRGSPQACPQDYESRWDQAKGLEHLLVGYVSNERKNKARFVGASNSARKDEWLLMEKNG